MERLPKACICNQKKHPLFGPGWRVGSGSEICPQGEDSGSYQRKVWRLGWGPPDLTLPLVEMAEMERPVMEVTVTESRMMIQVRTAGVGESLPQTQSEHFQNEKPEPANRFTMGLELLSFSESQCSHLRNGSLSTSWYILNSQGADKATCKGSLHMDREVFFSLIIRNTVIVTSC